MAVSAKATQEFVPLKEVRDGIAILKDGSMRALVMTSSLNFALQSEDMQNSIIFQFQNFLNSLDFSIQIYIQSRRLDIKPYLAKLEERYTAQINDLMKIQTREYIEFIKSFTDSTSIMTKTFLVVVPYTPSLGSEGGNLIGSMIRKKSAVEKTKQKLQTFEEHKTQMAERVSVIEQGLSRIGLRTTQIGTEEIIELFYKIFNPGETEASIHV